MWSFQQQKLNITNLFYARLMLWVTIVHFFLLSFLFLQQSVDQRLSFTINHQQIDHTLTLQIVPVFDSKQSTLKQQHSITKRSNTQSSPLMTTAITQKKDLEVKKETVKASPPKIVAKKEPIAKQTKEIMTKKPQKSTVPNKESLKKKQPAKTEKKTTQQLLPNKPTEIAKTNSVPIKQESAQAPVKQEPIKETKKEIVKSQPMITQVATKMIPEKEVIMATPKEIIAYNQTQELYNELARVWSPPQTITSVKPCIIKTVLNSQGTIEKTIIVQSSGALMYDVAARTALYTMQFPLWAKCTELTITFEA